MNNCNAFAYCENDSVMCSDESGNMPKWARNLSIGLAIVGGILVVGAITALTMGVGTTVLVTLMAGAIRNCSWYLNRCWCRSSCRDCMIRHFNKHIVEEGHKYLGNKVRVIIDPLTKLLLSFC